MSIHPNPRPARRRASTKLRTSLVVHERERRQAIEQTEQLMAAVQRTAGEFADDERITRDLARFEQLAQRRVAAPHGRGGGRISFWSAAPGYL